MSKIKVPQGMLQASVDACFPDMNLPVGNRKIEIALEAALRWLSENGDLEVSKLDMKTIFVEARSERGLQNEHCEPSGVTLGIQQEAIAMALRRMFLAPEEKESAYMRVTQAMGAVTISREEGDAIITYVKGAIHG